MFIISDNMPEELNGPINRFVTEISSDPGNDMWWNHYLVIDLLPGVDREDPRLANLYDHDSSLGQDARDKGTDVALARYANSIKRHPLVIDVTVAQYI